MNTGTSKTAKTNSRRTVSLLITSIFIVGYITIAADQEWAPKYQVNGVFPDFSAVDQWGSEKSIDTLMGGKGLVVFFNRSTVW